MQNITWSTTPFTELHALLTSPVADFSEVSAAVLARLPDLHRFLALPGKSDEGRREVTSGTFDIDGDKYSVNSEFITEACALADELGLDERLAATYLHYGAEYQLQLDRRPSQCAVILYHLRQEYILSSVRQLLVNARSPGDGEHTLEYLDLAKKLATPAFVVTVVRAMETQRANMRTFQEREASALFLGRDRDEAYSETLRYRREAMYKEHEMLAHIFALLCAHDFVNVTHAKSFLEMAATLEKYDQILTHYVVCIIWLFDALCASRNDGETAHTFPEVLQIHNYFKEQRRKQPLKLPHFYAAVEFWWIVYFRWFCNEQGSQQIIEQHKIDYEVDVYKPALACVTTGGAFAFMMNLTADLLDDAEPDTLHTDLRSILDAYSLMQRDAYENPVLQPLNETSRLEITYAVSDVFKQLLFDTLGNLLDAIIANFADLLMELFRGGNDSLPRLGYLVEDESVPPVDDRPPIHFELEMFFMTVSYLYSGRSDAALQFWSDVEGHLYGFLKWFSQCEEPLAVTAYCDMLASISSGPTSCAACFLFLKQGDLEQRVVALGEESGSQLSWNYMLETFNYYVARLSAAPEQMFPTTPSSSVMRTLVSMTEQPELNEDDSRVVSSYLRLIQSIITWDPAAREEFISGSAPGTATALNSLFDMLGCQATLVAPILDVFAALAAKSTRSVRLELWRRLDLWLLHAPVASRNHPSSSAGWPQQRMSFQDRFRILLPSYQDVVSLVALLECLTRVAVDSTMNELQFPDNLGENYRSQDGIRPYVLYIIDDIFFYSSASELSEPRRLTLQIVCLKFILNCIRNFNSNLVALTAISAGVDTRNGGSGEKSFLPASIVEYIRIHPCVWAMEKLFETKIYEILFGVAAQGIDKITTPGATRELSEKSVSVSLEVINTVLAIEDTYLDVMEPLVRSNDVSLIDPTSKTSAQAQSTHTFNGLRNFEEAILFNIYVVTQCALYVNSPNVRIASLSIKILDCISRSSQFLSFDYAAPSEGSYLNGMISGITTTKAFTRIDPGAPIGVNRLLSALDRVSESRRIIFGFITQLERPAAEDDDEFNELKLEILSFLSRNLCTRPFSKIARGMDGGHLDIDVATVSDVPTISHFLLGFKIMDGSTAASTASLQSNDDLGGINSSVSLFRVIITLLKESAGGAASNNNVFTKTTTQFTQLCADIMSRLCSARISSSLTLELLRENDYQLFESLVRAETLVSPQGTIWQGATFASLLARDEEEENVQMSLEPDAVLPTTGRSSKSRVDELDTVETFVHFLLARASMLDYGALELHSVADEGASLRFAKYVRDLTSMRGQESPSLSSQVEGTESKRGIVGCETAKALELLDFLEFSVEDLIATWDVRGTGVDIAKIAAAAEQRFGAKWEDDIAGASIAAAVRNVFASVRLEEKCLYYLSPVDGVSSTGDDVNSGGNSLNPADAMYNISLVLSILDITMAQHIQTGKVPQLGQEAVAWQREQIVLACRTYNAIVMLRRAQCVCLVAWCKLVRTVLADTTPEKRSNSAGRDVFILESMQILCPKILHYSQLWESKLADRLSSVLLALTAALSRYVVTDDVGGSDNGRDFSRDGDTAAMDITRTVLRVSLVAVQSPYSSPTMRADLYTLINIFICSHPSWRTGKLSQLQRTIESCSNGSASLSQLPSAVDAEQMLLTGGDLPQTPSRSSSTMARENRLIERVANDAVSGDGVTRIMALTVLRAFAAVENATGEYFVVGALMRYNLLLLLVRSLRRIDEELDDENRVSNYEVTAFKAVMALLVELARSHGGASQIIQSGLFILVQKLRFLAIYPEIGIFALTPRRSSPRSSSTSSSQTAPSSMQFWPSCDPGNAGGGTTSRNVFYELAAPTLRLLCCCLLSMGQRNAVVLAYVGEILRARELLVRSVLQRVAVLDLMQQRAGKAGALADEEDEESVAIAEAGKLVVLMCYLTNVRGN
ncbi:nucleoporin Nup186/Nup192/Nup205 [Limtongia smithiae]|uniref:nucleoporin Nup186/Nup192/Nup205 n=1 Tax=Limtongia smithiae TaxID=1125753 RepID=UPI0034D021A3